ncbi:MAG: hypothetical protein J1E01_08855 [Acetatifactor sp.]|nr:hypothetical protein [Acetatifactor sp.]
MIPVILGTVAAGLFLIGRMDRDVKPATGIMAGVLATGLAGGGLLGWLFGPGDFFSRLLLALVVGCLLLACVTDVVMYQVYDFVWWISGAAAAMLLWARLWVTNDVRNGLGILFGLTVFWIVQIWVFGRLYGKADCYAFCVCAAAETGLGMGLELIVTHMVFAFGMLVPVQFISKNITLRGNLKKPVAFIPYITAGFYLLLFFAKIYGEIVVP